MLLLNTMKLRKMSLVLSLTISLLSPSYLKASDGQSCPREKGVPTCEDVINKADTLIGKQKEEIKALEEKAAAAQKLAEDAMKGEKEAQDKANSWLHKPSYLVPLGATVAIGIILTPLAFVGSGLYIVAGIFGVN